MEVSLYDVLINQGKDNKTVEKLSKKFLTKNDDRNYVELLEGLVYKVFKEEWVRTLLALGYDPDKVIDKIDEYWDYREQGYELRTKKGNGRNYREKHSQRKKHHDKRQKHDDKKEKHHHKKDKHRHRHK